MDYSDSALLAVLSGGLLVLSVSLVVLITDVAAAAFLALLMGILFGFVAF